MGKAEDALRARAEAAVEAKRLEDAKREQEVRPAVEELRQEIHLTLDWLEQNDWPGGELRFVNDRSEERAMWNIDPTEEPYAGDKIMVYLDSTGSLQRHDMRRGGNLVELDLTLFPSQGYDEATIRAKYIKPIRKMRKN